MRRTGKTAEELLRPKYEYDEIAVRRIWHYINIYAFDGILTCPRVELVDDIDSALGSVGTTFQTKGALLFRPNNKFTLFLRKDLQSNELRYVIGHETVHQHITATLGWPATVSIGHGPEFMQYEKVLSKVPGMHLISGGYKIKGVDARFRNPNLLA
jgi:hypothetical protein